MYQLTYESDEDILAQGVDENNGTGDQVRKRENETIIFEKSDLAYSQNRWSPYPDYKSPNVEGKSKSEGLASTANVAYGIENESKSGKAAPSADANTSTESITSKQNSNFSHSGCRLCVLVVYLLLLTAAVAVAFVNLYELKNETYLLQHRLRILEHSAASRSDNPSKEHPKALSEERSESSAPNRPTREEVFKAKLSTNESKNRKRSNSHEKSLSLLNANGQDEKLQLVHQRQLYENPNNATSCCHSFQRSLATLDTKILENTRMFVAVRKLDRNFSFESITRIYALEKKMAKLDLNMKKSMEAKTKTTLDLMNLKYQLKILEKKLKIPKRETVAFSAHRAPSDLIVDIAEEFRADFLDKEQQASNLPVDLSYDNELINKRQNMNPDSGVFTVPYDGFYAFQIFFCTSKKRWNTTVGLTVNNTLLRTFRAPTIPSSSDIFGLDTISPDMNTSKKTRSVAYQHSYSAILELRKGEKVKLQLMSGSIFETNVLESQSCTQFSGFKIS